MTDPAASEAGRAFTVTIYLTLDDLERISDCYLNEHGEPPSMKSRKWASYCKRKIAAAVGAAGAAGWDEGAV